MKTKLFNIYSSFIFLFFITAKLFSITNPITGWSYIQTTQQTFYAFDNVLIDELNIDASGIEENEDGDPYCPSDSCDVIGAFIGETCIGWAWPELDQSDEFYIITVMGVDVNVSGSEGYAEVGVIPQFRIYFSSENVELDAYPSNNGDTFNDGDGNCEWNEGESVIIDLNDNGIYDAPEPVNGFQDNGFFTVDNLNSYFTNPLDCNEQPVPYNVDCEEEDNIYLVGCASIDECGICAGGDTCKEPNQLNSGVYSGPDVDCNGECFGDAVLDFCNDCTGGTTDLSFNQNLGCTDDGSEPTLDDCDSGYELDSVEVCCDGAIQTTWFDDTDGDMLGDSSMEYELCFPEEYDYVTNDNDLYPACYSNSVDDCGICDGFNENKDCLGICNGDAEEDFCGECDNNPENDNQSCMGCTDPGALNCEYEYYIQYCPECESGESVCEGFYDPSALIYDGSCQFEVWPGDTNLDREVTLEDILGIAIHWGETGSARLISEGTDYTWQAQTGYDNWSNKWALFADANGDGIVDVFDILVILVNYGMEVNSESYNSNLDSPYDESDIFLYRDNFELIYNQLINSNNNNIITQYLEGIFGFQSNINLPQEYKLYQNQPNPFNPITKIIYEVPQVGFVNLSITNILGKEIINYDQKINFPGTYQYEIDGSNLSSGIYFYHLTLESGMVLTRKMMLIK